jgi:hypothetical protein
MGRALLTIGIGILLGTLIAWMVLSSGPPPSPQQEVIGIRRPVVPGQGR